jgi:hypothetical protein
MAQPKRKLFNKTAWIVSGCVALLLLVGCIFIANLITSDMGPQKKIQISTVNLVPQPPPVVKEKPP